MGRLHTRSYRRVRDHFPECRAEPRLVIAADELPARARSASDELGYALSSTDWRDVIGHPEVDVVSITGPNHVHHALAIAAADAGKHFWAEKPLGRYPSETAEIAAAAEAAGIVTTVGFNYRQAPAVQHARELISSGQLGAVRNYRGYFLVDYASSPETALTWRFLRSSAGLGVLGDLMSHVVDMAVFLGGAITEVCAQTAIEIPRRPIPQSQGGGHFTHAGGSAMGEVENEDYAASLVRFATGAHGTLEVSRVTVGPRCRIGFDIHGTRGAMSWDFERMNELDLHLPGLSSGDIGYTRVVIGPQHGDFAHFQPGPGIPMGYDDLKVSEAHTFLESVMDGEHRSPSVLDARSMAEVVFAMQASRDAGRWQGVAPLRGAPAL